MSAPLTCRRRAQRRSRKGSRPPPSAPARCRRRAPRRRLPCSARRRGSRPGRRHRCRASSAWPRSASGTGFGTPEIFFAAAAACCAELDAPGIFLSAFLSAEQRQRGDRIACFDHVELEQLLPHAAAIVHHGGLGTTARALQAGIPQVIGPIGFDQPDNGHRVELLGAGRVVPRDCMSGATFATALREQLAEPEQPLKLARYRAALQSSRAVERAADLLEQVARDTLN